VLEAWDGAEAISILDERHGTAGEPTIILLDLLLPNMDGLAVLRHISEHRYPILVVAMSTDRNYLRAAEAVGARATLRKPFHLDQLLGIVERYARQTV
jgi:CheY-like chemotaxis protein